MQVITRPNDSNEVMIIQVLGDLDLSSVPAVRSAAQSAVDDGWVHLVFDVQDVGFLDSAGIGVLIGARRRCVSSGGSLSLVGIDSAVHRTLELADVGALFACVQSVDAAADMVKAAVAEAAT